MKAKIWREENKEALSVKAKNYYKENRENILQSVKKY